MGNHGKKTPLIEQPAFTIDKVHAECDRREIVLTTNGTHWMLNDSCGRRLLDYYSRTGKGCASGRWSLVGDWRAAIEFAANRIETPPNAEIVHWARGESDKLGMTLSISTISKRGAQHWVFKCSSTGRMLLSYYPRTNRGFRPGVKVYDIGDEHAAIEEARKILNAGEEASLDPSDEYRAMFAK